MKTGHARGDSPSAHISKIVVDNIASRRQTRSHAYVQAHRHRDSMPGEHSKEWITGGACALAIEQYRMSHKASPETDEAFFLVRVIRPAH
ncbi:hypothetical protein [Burkholderia stabilis]|uniref:hypothetical protein n=1 Tax=Burkholderia stabilis TaxID=95485 RepID=UPI0013CEB334|nr:hypothetical protein [Burkholderia stabilis]